MQQQTANLKILTLGNWRHSLLLLFLLVVGAGEIASCSPTSQSSSPESSLVQEKPTVYVTNYPLQYFAERIAGDGAIVQYPVPADIDPAFWNPGADTIAQLQTGDLIFINGATYEKWLETVSLPLSKLVDTSESFRDNYIEIENAVTHSHGPEGEHAHTGIAFTTWLNFDHAIAQADAIRAALSQMRPDLAVAFQANFESLKQDLQELDTQLQAIVSANPDILLAASHPVYNYLAQRYGLNLKSVLWETDVVPNEVQWRDLEKMLKDHPARWMIWEGDPNGESVARLEAIGIQSIVFDSAENTPEKADFVDVMQQNLKNLQQVYSVDKP